MPALATATVTGPSARSAAAKKACPDFSLPHVDSAGEDPLAAQPGRRALHRVLAQVAQRHPGAGGVECLGDTLADAGPGPRDDDHGIGEVEAAHAHCLSCHRGPSSELVNQTPL